MAILNKMSLVLVASTPMFALAHPGHGHDSSFWTGLVHPFTGLDHFMMALALGVLLWTATKRWKMVGVLGLAAAMLFGFVLGQQHIFTNAWAEYGIVLSLAVVSGALLCRAQGLFAVATLILASFHGMAHGNELGQVGHVLPLVTGMLVAMSLIYAMGLGLGYFIQQHVPYGRKIVAAAAAVLVVMSLT